MMPIGAIEHAGAITPPPRDAELIALDNYAAWYSLKPRTDFDNLQGMGCECNHGDCMISEIMEDSDDVTVLLKKQNGKEAWCWPNQITQLFEWCADCMKPKDDCDGDPCSICGKPQHGATDDELCSGHDFHGYTDAERNGVCT